MYRFIYCARDGSRNVREHRTLSSLYEYYVQACLVEGEKPLRLKTIESRMRKTRLFVFGSSPGYSLTFEKI